MGSHLHLVALIVRDYGAASRPPVLTMRWWRLVSDQASIRVARQRRLKTDWNVVADDGSVVPRLRRCRRRSGRVVIYGTQIAGVHRVALPITGSFATEWVLDLKPQTIERRVERLERRVTRLEELPGRVDALTAQFLQLRAEIGSEFSAVRLEMRESAAVVKKELVHEIGRMHEHTMTEVMDRIDVAVLQLSGQMQGFQDEVRGFQQQVVASLNAIHERLPPR